MPNSKAHLSDYVELMVLDFLERGGSITQCRPGIAQGASFTRNTSPFNKLQGVEEPSVFG